MPTIQYLVPLQMASFYDVQCALSDLMDKEKGQLTRAVHMMRRRLYSNSVIRTLHSRAHLRPLTSVTRQILTIFTTQRMIHS